MWYVLVCCNFVCFDVLLCDLSCSLQVWCSVVRYGVVLSGGVCSGVARLAMLYVAWRFTA